MRKSAVLSVVCIFLAFGASTAFAQMVGLDWVPTGSGARALGMGGAFTAIADDATAAWWNPAGLTQLERPEFSLVAQYRTVDAEIVSSGTSMSGTKDTLSANFASAVFPIGGKTEGARKTVSISYGTFMDFNFEAEGSPVNYRRYKGTLDNARLSFATELSPNLSLGAGLTYLFGGFKESSMYGAPTNFYNAENDITGYGAEAGLLWKAKNFSIGLMGRTSLRLRLDTSGERTPGPTSFHDVAILRYPYALGAGAAYKPTENFTAALDVQYINLSAFKTGADEAYGDIVQPRLGLEYLIITKDQNIIPLRAGAYYNPAGVLDSSGSEVSGYGYTAGTGIVFKDFQIDLAYIHAERDAYRIHTSDAVNKDVTQRVLLSAIYRF